MPTDLRAALRDMLTTRDEDEQERLSRIEAAIAALADAPSTVAELLAALPEPSLNGHTIVGWTIGDVEHRARRTGAHRLVVKFRRAGEETWWHSALSHADLTAPARLVEVAP